MDNVSKVISGQDKYRKCECESGSEENISSVFALAPTLALFSVPGAGLESILLHLTSLE